VQRALLGVAHGSRLGRWLGFLGLLGHHDRLLGRGHHGANGFCLGQGLAAALFQIAGTGRLFVRAALASAWAFSRASAWAAARAAASAACSRVAFCFTAEAWAFFSASWAA